MDWDIGLGWRMPGRTFMMDQFHGEQKGRGELVRYAESMLGRIATIWGREMGLRRVSM
jgi:hypothetical protein